MSSYKAVANSNNCMQINAILEIIKLACNNMKCYIGLWIVFERNYTIAFVMNIVSNE